MSLKRFQLATDRYRTTEQKWVLLILWVALAAVATHWLQRLHNPAISPVTSFKIPCLSYAPFRRANTSPFKVDQSISPAQTEVDLTIIKKSSNCVRTYGVGQGLSAVPDIAAKLGMTVKLGAWIARDPAANQLELQTAVRLAKQFPGTVTALIVGNEVLLRQDLTPEKLRELLQFAKQNTSVPIVYADVWEYWLRHKTLAADVDIVGIHILPYWEDDPVSVDNGVDHVMATANKVAALFAPKKVWVAEVGWPSAGRQRGPAVPGDRQQAQFVTQLSRTLSSNDAQQNVEFNLIEAFDQPWKKQLEGAMGGHWGLFDQYGEAKPTATVALPLIVIGTMLIGAAIFSYVRSAQTGALIGVMIGLLAALIEFAMLWNLTPLQWLITALTVGIMVFGCFAKSGRWVAVVAFFFVSLLIWQLGLLYVDGRYRGFNWAMFAAATVVMLRLFKSRPAMPRGWLYCYRTMLVLVSVSAAAVLSNEGLVNHQALTVFVLAQVFVVTGWLVFRNGFRA